MAAAHTALTTYGAFKDWCALVGIPYRTAKGIAARMGKQGDGGETGPRPPGTGTPKPPVPMPSNEDGDDAADANGKIELVWPQDQYQLNVDSILLANSGR